MNGTVCPSFITYLYLILYVSSIICYTYEMIDVKDKKDI